MFCAACGWRRSCSVMFVLSCCVYTGEGSRRLQQAERCQGQVAATAEITHTHTSDGDVVSAALSSSSSTPSTSQLASIADRITTLPPVGDAGCAPPSDVLVSSSSSTASYPSPSKGLSITQKRKKGTKTDTSSVKKTRL